MTGDEFLHRPRRLGRERGVAVRFDGKPGKGSHDRISYGSRFTTLNDPRKEIGSGLPGKMPRDLALTRADLIQAGEAPMRFAWPAQIRRDDEDGRYLVTFRDFPEAGTDGADEAEALAEAEDCLTSVILLRAKYGEPIPTPSRPCRGERPITPDPAVALKAALHVALRRRGMSAADLARAGWITGRRGASSTRGTPPSCRAWRRPWRRSGCAWSSISMRRRSGPMSLKLTPLPPGTTGYMNGNLQAQRTVQILNAWEY